MYWKAGKDMDKTNIDISHIAERYERYSSVQKSAADILLRLLEIKGTDDVLDLGCGAGNLTRTIRTMTNAKVVGIDPSEAQFLYCLKRQSSFIPIKGRQRIRANRMKRI